MFEVAGQALLNLLHISVLGYLVLGVAVGTVIGILPGLGGVVGMSILVPFIYGMDPTTGLALLIGMSAVTATSDTYTSVLLGVPGGSASQATILDGYPLSQQGRGAEALGASFFASMIGGMFGALVLFVCIFVARPLILLFGAPELFMLTVLGLCMVGLLTAGARRIGLLSGAVGLLLGSVGGAPTAPVYRFTMDQVYLFDGIPIAVLAIGIFAIPEMLDLLIEKRSVVARGVEIRGSQLDGMKQVLRHKALVLRSSAIGCFIGMLPGLGGSVGHWVAYGVASRTSKNNQNFGKGDIRGVIAPEAANNASDGGGLIPTLMFGIPGSGSMAILLGGFSLMGLQAGPRMISEQLPLTLSIVWMLAIANVLGTAVALGLTRWVVKLTTIRASLFTPFLFVLLFAAAYQSSRNWGDIIALLVLGFMGWVMKQLGWPRAPLLIGFVLAKPAERYLWISIGTYGYSWLWHPAVLAIGAVIVLLAAYGMRLRGQVEQAEIEAGSEAGPKPTIAS